MSKKKISKGKITGLLIGLLLCGATFVVLTIVQRQILLDTETTVVVLAKKEIEKGTEITDANMKDFFYEKEISVSLAIPKTFKSLKQLAGYYPVRTIHTDEIVYEGTLYNKEKQINEYEHPIEISISIEKEVEAVAGTIRKGNYVDVYAISKEGTAEEGYELVLEHILVNDVFDDSTQKITASDTESKAMMFTFYAEQASVPDILNTLTDKTIYVTTEK